MAKKKASTAKYDLLSPAARRSCGTKALPGQPVTLPTELGDRMVADGGARLHTPKRAPAKKKKATSSAAESREKAAE